MATNQLFNIATTPAYINIMKVMDCYGRLGTLPETIDYLGVSKDEYVKSLLLSSGFHPRKFLSNIDLSSMTTRNGLKHLNGAWWVNNDMCSGTIVDVLGYAVYFSNGANTSTVIAVDPNMNRVLTETGSVYSLGERWPDRNGPGEVAVRFTGADDYLYDGELAYAYVLEREDDAEKFVKELKWANSEGFVNCIYADTCNVRIIHELKPASLHCGALWGELFYEQKEGTDHKDPIIFYTFYNFVAYMLAKYW